MPVGRLPVPLVAGDPEEVYHEDEFAVTEDDITDEDVEMLMDLRPNLSRAKALSLLLSSVEA